MKIGQKIYNKFRVVRGKIKREEDLKKEWLELDEFQKIVRENQNLSAVDVMKENGIEVIG